MIIYSHLNLKELDEKEFIKEWLNDIKFVFLNLL